MEEGVCHDAGIWKNNILSRGNSKSKMSWGRNTLQLFKEEQAASEDGA